VRQNSDAIVDCLYIIGKISVVNIKQFISSAGFTSADFARERSSVITNTFLALIRVLFQISGMRIFSPTILMLQHSYFSM